MKKKQKHRGKSRFTDKQMADIVKRADEIEKNRTPEERAKFERELEGLRRMDRITGDDLNIRMTE